MQSSYSWGKLYIRYDDADYSDKTYFKDPFPWLLDQPAGTVVYQGDGAATVVNQEWYNTGSQRDGRKTVCVDAVQIREGTKNIMPRAGYNLQASRVVMPESVELIDKKAFHQANIDDIVMEGVKEIGDSAFFEAQMKSISMPNVEKIGYRAFAKSGITELSNTLALKSIGSSAFSDCEALASVTLPPLLTTINYGTFLNCTALTSVTIPYGVTSVGPSAFCNCTALKTVILLNPSVQLSSNAFANSRLENLTLPVSVNSIHQYAFRNCVGLANLTLTGIGSWNKNTLGETSISELNTLNVGCGVTSLGDCNFKTNVVNCYADTPPACTDNTFRYYKSTLHVPIEAVGAYFTAPVWENFGNLRNDLSDKVTLSQAEAHMLKGDKLQLTAVTVPDAEVIWLSSDPTVATVDVSGKVTATDVGECDIYASLADNLAVYAACHIDVHNQAVISLPTGFLTIRPNTIATLTPMFDPEPVNIVATSSDPSVAIVRVVKKDDATTRAPVAGDKQVQVLGITQGTATITVASADGQSVPATCEITVVALEPTDSITHDKHNPAEYLSGTLPVLYVNTVGEQEIVSRDEYLSGTYYLDAHGLEGYENIGSAEAPLALQIKGRGNFSWGYDKKPYRLKFDKKAAPLGMKKSKHFVLLANCEDGAMSLYKDVLGLWLGKQLGLDWTPDIKPVELVINGDYRGLYNLAEQVRVDPDRVNVVEQDDEESVPELVTGGWLVEMEDYSLPAYAHGDGTQVINQTNTGGGRDEGTAASGGAQLVIRSQIDGSLMRFLPKTPEVLSDVQFAYLTGLVLAVDSLINVEDKDNRAWEELIDIDALARYYLVNEVMYDVEAFSGSCFFHKERGNDTKMVFGPVWDFGAAADEWMPEQESFLYNNEYMMPFRTNHWIGEIAKFPRFQERVKAHWSHYANSVHSEMAASLLQYYQTIATAATDGDYRRWPQHGGNGTLNACQSVLRHLEQHYNWLVSQWGHGYQGDVNGDDVVNGADITALYNVILNGGTASGFADVNGDGIVNGADVTALYNLLLK